MAAEHGNRRLLEPSRLEGLITEQHLELAEHEFPGIARFHRSAAESPEPPRTFLDLLVRYGAFARPGGR